MRLSPGNCRGSYAAPTQVLLNSASAISPYSQRRYGELQIPFLTSSASTGSDSATSEYHSVKQNEASDWNDAQGPASSTSIYSLPSASSLVGCPPVTHRSSTPLVGVYNYSSGSLTGEECGLLDAQSHSDYYYNVLTSQRQTLAKVNTAHCHDSGFNNDAAFACTVPNQTQFQDPETLLTGSNIYFNPDTGFEGSAPVGHTIQPYEHIPGPDVNGGHHSGSYIPFGGWSPASQSMQAPPAIATQAPILIQCTALGCSATFKREPDRLRHESAVHGINQLLQFYLCPVIGCSKSQGSGYTRKDKLTEHLWKKHGNLGYTKRV
jgi:hypothetical protein